MATITDNPVSASILTGINGEDDSISGLDLNDTLVATTGDDTLNGGDGDDVADYENSGFAIQLLSQGQIAKGPFVLSGDTVFGDSGTDVIQNIETIIGDPTQDNVINGVNFGTIFGDSFGSGNATFDVDLLNDSLTITPVTPVTGVFEDPITFTVENFNIVFGTNNNDSIVGNDNANILLGEDGDDFIEGRAGRDLIDGGEGDDTLFGNRGLDTILGSSGNDSINGGGGRDTLDYSDFEGDVVLVSQGFIDKFVDDGMGNFVVFDGTDSIQSIETIIGNENFINVIDGFVDPTAPSNGSFDVNLADQNLTVNIDTTTPGVPASISFEVINFIDVVGTRNDDSITGDDQDNFIFGSEGIDTINGGGGNDTANYEGLGRIILFPTGTVAKFNEDSDLVGWDFTSDGFETFISGTSDITGGFRDFLEFGGIVDAVNEEGAQLNVNLNTETLEVVIFGTTVPVVDTTIEGFQGVRGTANNDTVVGDDQNNVFFVSGGDDVYNGEYAAVTPTTVNVLSYQNTTALPTATEDISITLLSQGQIAKTDSDGNDFGTDRIQNIQIIEGNENVINTIDGVSDGAFFDNGNNATFDINLLNDSLTITPFVANSFFPSAVTFTVENFDNVIGTNRNDSIVANDNANTVFGADGDDLIEGRSGRDLLDGGAGDDTISGNRGLDTIVGSTGSDTINGGGGTDTLDYSGTDIAVALGSRGVIAKSNSYSDTDNIVSIERIIGDSTQENFIDGTLGTTPGQENGSFVINLRENSLTVNIDTMTPGVPSSIDFEVFNFNNVIGTVNDDLITGGNGIQLFNGEDGDDVLNGFGNNDFLIGGNGNDTLNGGTGRDTLIGVGEDLGATDFDRLNGGKKADTFVLGDATNAFYVGIGFAEILDFQSGIDTIQLNGVESDYTFGTNSILLGGDQIGTTDAAFNVATDFTFVSV